MEETSEISPESSEQTEELLDVVDLANISDEEDTANQSSEQTESEAAKQQSSESISKPVKDLQLPFAKIKHIMKMDPDVQLVQKDAISLVGKATELFIEFLTKEAYKQLVGQKRKTVMKRDIDVTIENIAQLCFLDGALE